MFKNITRQLQALLSRHLPHRLVQRDPLPNATEPRLDTLIAAMPDLDA